MDFAQKDWIVELEQWPQSSEKVAIVHARERDLRAALKCTNALVRTKAMQLLASASINIVEDLIMMLTEDASPVVRHEVAFALGALGDPRGAASLITAMQTDPSALVRHEAAEALGTLGDGLALDELRHTVTSDPEPDVRETAGISIEQIEMLLKRRLPQASSVFRET